MPYDIKNGSFWVVGLQEIFMCVSQSTNTYFYILKKILRKSWKKTLTEKEKKNL